MAGRCEGTQTHGRPISADLARQHHFICKSTRQEHDRAAALFATRTGCLHSRASLAISYHRRDSNPHSSSLKTDFKSVASTGSATVAKAAGEVIARKSATLPKAVRLQPAPRGSPRLPCGAPVRKLPFAGGRGHCGRTAVAAGAGWVSMRPSRWAVTSRI